MQSIRQKRHHAIIKREVTSSSHDTVHTEAHPNSKPPASQVTKPNGFSFLVSKIQILASISNPFSDTEVFEQAVSVHQQSSQIHVPTGFLQLLYCLEFAASTQNYYPSQNTIMSTFPSILLTLLCTPSIPALNPISLTVTLTSSSPLPSTPHSFSSSFHPHP